MKIIFVCTGNASRSAVAEVILKKMLADEGIKDVNVTSCGTNVPEGLQREEIMSRIAAEHGYTLTGSAVHMNARLLNSADLIIVMTEHHRWEVMQLLAETPDQQTQSPHNNSPVHDMRQQLTAPRYTPNIVLFNDYCFHEPTDLPDPHYQSEYVYRTCFSTIHKGCTEITRKFKSFR
ncbi:MAG: hypothetical protein K2M79_00375 [Muribaculaceae bacterium]|nr:hypothetical protein [Muribaculaceae bacterium]